MQKKEKGRKRLLRIVSFFLVLALFVCETQKTGADLIEAAARKYVKTLKLSKSKVRVKKGRTQKVTFKIQARKGASKKVTAKAKNSKIVKVSVKGKKISIKGKKKGSTKVYVTTKGKNKKGKKIKKTIAVTVTSDASNGNDVSADQENRSDNKSSANTDTPSEPGKPGASLSGDAGKPSAANVPSKAPSQDTASPSAATLPSAAPSGDVSDPVLSDTSDPGLSKETETPAPTDGNASPVPAGTSSPVPVRTSSPTENVKQVYTRQQWLKLLSDKLDFNLEGDIDEDVYYFADTPGKEYGKTAEMAQAYDLLPACDAKGYEDPEQDLPLFEADKVVTREYAAYTIVKAAGFVEDAKQELNCDDQSELKYENMDAIAVNKGILDLDDNYFRPSAALSRKDGNKMLSYIDEINASTEVSVTEEKENVEYQEGVVGADSIQTTDYTIKENEDGTYTVRIMANAAVRALKEGDVYILPAKEGKSTGTALKVKEVAGRQGRYMELLCEKPELEEVLSDVSFEGTGTVDIANIQPAEDVQYEYVENTENQETGGEQNPRKKISLGGSASLPNVASFEVKDKMIGDFVKASGKIEVTIPDVTCKVDADIGLLSGVDFNEFVIKMTDKIQLSSDIECTFTESGYEITDSNGNASWEGGSIEIGRIPIQLGATGLFINLVFSYNINAKGYATVTYVIETTQGLQIIDGSPRLIHDFSQSIDELEMKGSAKVGVEIDAILNALELTDLAGFETVWGLGAKASFTPHLDRNPKLYCGDAHLYAFGKASLSQDTLLWKFLEKVTEINRTWTIFDEGSSPLQLRLHLENGSRVEKCTYGVGAIEGVVRDSDENPVKDARVQLYQNGVLLKNLYSGADGTYKMDGLSAGEYKLKISVTGYAAYETVENVQNGRTTFVETLIMLSRDENVGEGQVTGDIIDAVTGDPVEDVKYYVRKNWNNTTGAVLSEGAASKEYDFTLPAGNYTVQFTADGYIDCEINIAVSSGNTLYKNVAFSPVLTKDDGLLRVVLSWGEYPEDLDSHMLGPTGNEDENFHIYFDDQKYNEYNEVTDEYEDIADLDLDDITSYGPETVTLHKVDMTGNYRYYVHDFTNRSESSSGLLAQSNAQVRIYKGTTLLQKFNVPNREGTLWHVFDYNASTDTIVPINGMTYETEPGKVGSGNEETPTTPGATLKPLPGATTRPQPDSTKKPQPASTRTPQPTDEPLPTYPPLKDPVIKIAESNEGSGTANKGDVASKYHCDVEWGEDGSVTFTNINGYNGGMMFNLQGGEQVDISKYKWLVADVDTEDKVMVKMHSDSTNFWSQMNDGMFEGAGNSGRRRVMINIENGMGDMRADGVAAVNVTANGVDEYGENVPSEITIYSIELWETEDGNPTSTAKPTRTPVITPKPTPYNGPTETPEPIPSFDPPEEEPFKDLDMPADYTVYEADLSTAEAPSGGDLVYDAATKTLSVKDASVFTIDLPEEIQGDESVYVNVIGILNGENGFRSYLIPGSDNYLSNIVLSDQYGIPYKKPFNWVFKLTADATLVEEMGPATKLQFKGKTYADVIDNLRVAHIIIGYDKNVVMNAPDPPEEEPSAVPTEKPSAVPTEEPGVQKVDTDVALTNENAVKEGPLYDADWNPAEQAIENEDGSITINTSARYSGGGMWFYLNNDKSAFDISKYSKIQITVAAKETGRGLYLGLVCDGKKSPPLGGDPTNVKLDAKPSSYPTMSGDDEDDIFEVDLSDIAIPQDTDLGADCSIVGIDIKYNGYMMPTEDATEEEKEAYRTTYTIKSIKFIK